MYLSAIVIFGKEISPWWIAGGVGTGVVVAAVIIYMRNHKDDDPNFKAPKIKDIKKVYKRPVKEEVIAEPEVPIIKESTIVPVISEQIAPQGVISEQIPVEQVVLAPISEQIAPQDPVIAEGISKLKLRLIATEELKLTKESKLTETINTLNQNKLKLGQINESIYKMGVIDDKASKETIKARQYLGITKNNLLKEQRDLVKIKLNMESHLREINQDLIIINTTIEEIQEGVNDPINLLSYVNNILGYVPIICLNIYQIYQATNAIMVISIIAKGVTNMCMFKIFLICLKAIIIGSPIWILIGTIVYKIIKYMSS